MALVSFGAVNTWGFNSDHQTDVPFAILSARGVSAGYAHTVVVLGDGTVAAWGNNDYFQTDVPVGLRGVQSVAAGDYHNAAVVAPTVAFDDQASGTTSDAKTITVRNTGDATLTLSAPVLLGGAAANFTINSAGMITNVPPGGSTTFTVTFSPTSVGLVRTTLRLNNNDSDEGSFEVQLTGNGTGSAPEIAVAHVVHTSEEEENEDNTGIVSFTNTPLGFPRTLTFTIRNVGNLPLSGLSISSTGVNASDFMVTQPPTLVAASDSVTFTVTFDPATPGDRIATVVVSSNDADEGFFEINVWASGFIGAPEVVFQNMMGPALLPSRVIGWGNTLEGDVTEALSLPLVTSIAAGYSHALALQSDGSVAAWEGLSARPTVPVTAQSNVTAISAGLDYSLALLNTGAVTAWGNHSLSGQTAVPTSVGSNIIGIANGYNHCLALSSSGRVIAWSPGASAELTVPGTVSSGMRAIAGGTDFSLAVRDSDGRVIAWGENMSGQTTVPALALAGAVRVAAGQAHGLALRGSDGRVIAWGSNTHTQTNVPPEAQSDMVAIAAGSNHSLALSDAGSVIAWGNNDHGQSFVPFEAMSNVVAIAAGGDQSLALIGGPTFTFFDQEVTTPSLARSLVIRNTGTAPLTVTSVSITGANAADFSFSSAALPITIPVDGQNSVSITFTPSALGTRQASLRVLSSDADEGDFTITLKGKGIGAGSPEIAVFNGVSTAPANERQTDIGSLGFSPTAVSASTVQTFTVSNTGTSTLRDLVTYVTGPDSADFVVSEFDSRLLAAGAQTTFTVTFAPSAIGPRAATVQIFSNDADESTFGISVSGTGTLAAPDITMELPGGSPLSAGTVIGWGQTLTGDATAQLSMGSAQAIAAGNPHSVALQTDGMIVEWRYNTTRLITPTILSAFPIVAISAGLDHTMALDSDGRVFAWNQGSLGSGNTVPLDAQSGVIAIAEGARHQLALKTDGRVISWGPDTYGDNVVPPSAESGMRAIAAGNNYSLALRNSDGQVFAWGSNGQGQTTVPAEALSGVQSIAAGSYHSLAVRGSDGRVFAWGSNASNQATVPLGAQSGVIAVAGGESHSLALRDDGSVVAWGSNTNGQTTIPLAAQSGVIAIAAGAQHSLALLGATHTFSTRSVATSSPPQTFVIRSTGNVPLTLSAISITGANAADFSVNTVGTLSTLPVGIQTTLSVTFTPSAVGSRSATLRVLSNDTDEGIFIVRLNGDGTAAIDCPTWIANFLPPGASAGERAGSFDYDHDGFTNEDEWIALTDPSNPASRFASSAPELSGDNLIISVFTSAGRVYRLRESDDLTSWSFSAGQPTLSGNDAVQSFTVPRGVGARRFYDITVALP